MTISDGNEIKGILAHFEEKPVQRLEIPWVVTAAPIARNYMATFATGQHYIRYF